MKRLFAILLLVFVLVAVPSTDGTVRESSEYQAPDGIYSYFTWGAGTEAQPYGSTVTGLDSESDAIYIQAALEGYPVRTIESLEGCSAEILVVPSTVESIGYGAFDGCRDLKTVYFLGDRPEGVLPGDVSVIHLEGTSGWGDGDVLPLETWEGDGCSFYYYIIDGKATVHALATGKDITIPSTTADGIPFRAVGDLAFKDADITSVSMGEGIEEIGVRAFYGCWYLTDVVYPSTLGILRDECFRDCLRLTSGDLPDVEFIGFETFRECKALPYAVIPDSVSTLHDGAFYLCRAARTIEIGEKITAIPPRCFGYCDSVSEVELPERVTEIGWSAFYSCISLESIGLENICSIGDDAFYGCYLLGSTGDLDSVESIGDRAFSGCRSLESLELSGSLEVIGREAFDGCRSLTSLRFLGDMPEIGNLAIPAGTEVVCLSSHADSWRSYDGELTVEDVGGSGLDSTILLIVACAVILVVSMLFFIRKVR